MPNGASWRFFFGSRSGWNSPKNVRNRKIMQYINVKTLAIQATIGISAPKVSSWKASNFKISTVSLKNISLLKNPLNGGKPAIDRPEIKAIKKVIGMIFINPPSLRISRVPVSWSIIPTTINKLPLKVEWLNKWKIAAKRAAV